MLNLKNKKIIYDCVEFVKFTLPILLTITTLGIILLCPFYYWLRVSLFGSLFIWSILFALKNTINNFVEYKKCNMIGTVYENYSVLFAYMIVCISFLAFVIMVLGS